MPLSIERQIEDNIKGCLYILGIVPLSTDIPMLLNVTINHSINNHKAYQNDH